MPVPNAGLLPTQMWGQPPAPMPGQMSAQMAAQMSPQIGGNMPAQFAAQASAQMADQQPLPRMGYAPVPMTGQALAQMAGAEPGPWPGYGNIPPEWPTQDGRSEGMDTPHGRLQAPVGAGVAPSPYGFNGGAPWYGADPRSMMPGAPMNAWNSPPPPDPPPTRARPRTVTAAARQPPPLGWPEGTEMLEDVLSLRRLRPLPDVPGALEVRGAPGPAGDEHLPRLDVVQRVLVLSDTSRDSQFESASSKCEPPPGGWFIGRFMATGVGLLAQQWSLLAVPH